MGSHAAVAAELLGSRELVEGVLADWRTSALDERHKALFAYLDKVCADAALIARADVDEVVRAGWTEEAIYDAITVCALFQFYNMWIDASGVPDMPADAYRASGQRMAAHGYAPPQ